MLFRIPAILSKGFEQSHGSCARSVSMVTKGALVVTDEKNLFFFILTFRRFLLVYPIHIDGHRDLAISRKRPRLLLAVDRVPLPLDLEDAALADDQFKLDSVLPVSLGQLSRQTGSLWFVVSLPAIGDSKLHDDSSIPELVFRQIH